MMLLLLSTLFLLKAGYSQFVQQQYFYPQPMLQQTPLFIHYPQQQFVQLEENDNEAYRPLIQFPNYGLQYYQPQQYMQPQFQNQLYQRGTLPFMYGMSRKEKDNDGGNEFRDEKGTYEEEDNGLTLHPHVNPLSMFNKASYLSLINDKDNFQVSGCAWDIFQQKCVDAIGLCKGGCRDFAVSTTTAIHDCRCIPYGYAALLKLAGK